MTTYQTGVPGIDSQTGFNVISQSCQSRSASTEFAAGGGEAHLASGLPNLTAKILTFDKTRTGVRVAINSDSATDSYAAGTGAFLVNVSGVDSNGDAKSVWVRVESGTETVITENQDGTGGDVLWWAVNNMIVLPSFPADAKGDPALNVGNLHVGVPTADGGTWAGNLAANGTLWACIAAAEGMSSAVFYMQPSGNRLFLKDMFLIGDNDSNNLTVAKIYRNNMFGKIDLLPLQFQIHDQVFLDLDSVPPLAPGDAMWVTVSAGGGSNHLASGHLNCLVLELLPI